ncbi:MAG TPA: DNA primase [Cyclobacteriaceae bacterium]|nr:DNA primase [Cyclobacteriaceae bacterium]
MGISRITTEKVRERADIEDVVNDYVPLKKRGQNLWACCPFHHEKSPSFSVSPVKQFYKCFGCGKAGDAIQFIMDIEGIGFNEAIRHLANKYGIEVEEETAPTPELVQAYNERESLYIALGFAKDFFVENLSTDEGKAVGLSYFIERGFTPKIIEKFDLGYALDGWDYMLKAAKAAGFKEDILLKAGLVLEKEGDASRLYDRFRNRVIFTIHNLGGKPIGFGARILKQDKKQPKYINSPETEVYHKSDVLYGMFQAKQAMRQMDNCYLVEGYTDVISLHLSGIENVVASSGTSLTENQIKLIKRFTDNVTVLYDGDPAGIKASLRGIDMLLEGGLNVKAVVFPEGEDPDSYSRKVGSQTFKNYLQEQAKDFLSFKIALYAKEIETDPIQRAEVTRQVIQSIGKIPDPLIRAAYIKETSKLLEVEEDVIHIELNKLLFKKKKDHFSKPVDGVPESPLEDLLPQAKKEGLSSAKLLALSEKETLRLLINYGFEKLAEDLHVCDYLLQEVQDLEFATPVYQRILAAYKSALENGILPDINYFLGMNDAEIKREVIDLITMAHEISPNWEKRHLIFTNKEQDNLSKAVYEGVLRLKRRVVKKLLDEAMNKVKEAKEEEVEGLLAIYMELKNYQVDIDRQLGTVISH